MSTYAFETVAVPAGAFVGWHDQPGQIVSGAWPTGQARIATSSAA